MKFQINVEYGQDKFVKFYTEADVIDGIVRSYSFSSLVEDIRRTCGSLRHHTSNTLRIRYKDEDGDYVNLNADDTDNFQEMFVRARSVDEGLHRKILLRVSELDSPVVQPLDLVKKRKLREMSTSPSESEQKLDPRSLDRSFENAATVRNLIKYNDHVSLDRDLLILEKALNGKIPEFNVSEDWQLPVLIEQYRNRNVDMYLNSAVERRSSARFLSN